MSLETKTQKFREFLNNLCGKKILELKGVDIHKLKNGMMVWPKQKYFGYGCEEILYQERNQHVVIYRKPRNSSKVDILEVLEDMPISKVEEKCLEYALKESAKYVQL